MPAWSQIVESLGPVPTDPNERLNEMATARAQNWILAQVQAGHFVPIEWVTIEVSNAAGWRARFRVASEPLRLGDESDSVVPITSADTAQRIAYLLDGVIPTNVLGDAMATQGHVVDYVNETYGDVADISRAQMVANSRLYDQLKRPGLNVWGKMWIPHFWYNAPDRFGLRGGIDTGINYGAWTTTPAGPGGKTPWNSTSREVRVWQPPGGTGTHWHNRKHTDISQKAPQLVHREVELFSPDGAWSREDIQTVASNPATADLLSTGGPLDMAIPIGADPGGPGPSPGGPTPTTPVGDKPPTSRAAVVVVMVLTAVAAAVALVEDW